MAVWTRCPQAYDFNNHERRLDDDSRRLTWHDRENGAEQPSNKERYLRARQGHERHARDPG
jgi:hypothetical protein